MSSAAPTDKENAAPGPVPKPDEPLAAARRRPRPRALAADAAVDAAGLPPLDALTADADTEYERERAARIQRNRAMLAALAVPAAVAAVEATAPAPPPPRAAPRPRPPKRRDAPAPAPLPTRQSARRRGLAPEVDAGAPLPDDDGGGGGSARGGRDDLLTLDAYWRERGGNPVADPIVSDGCFRGWVAPDVCARFGIESSAAAAWDAHGGGKFSFKIDKAAIPAALKARGWSDARAFAATQLRKNPNAYFYRHVEPGQVQATGEWTAEEKATFIRVARENGVGDKWGLFSSHLPQRVGYQCSAYYREVIIPEGHALDDRFRMTRSGKAVYVGGGGGGGGGGGDDDAARAAE